MSSSQATVAVVVAAKDEAAVIEQALRTIGALDHPAGSCELHVIDDGSTDDTSALARRVACDVPMLMSVHTHSDSCGKAQRLNDCIAQLDSEFVLILDADHHVKPDLLRTMLRHFERDPGVGCVQIASAVRNGQDNLLTRAIEMEYDFRCHGIYPGKTRGVFVGSGGMFRRQDLLAAGLFRTDMLTEDVEVSYRLYEHGRRIVYDRTATTGDESVTQLSEFFRQRYRWMRGIGQALGTHWRDRRLGVSERAYLLQFSMDGLGAFCLTILQAYFFLGLVGWVPRLPFWAPGTYMAVCALAFGVGMVRAGRARHLGWLPLVSLYMVVHSAPMAWAMVDGLLLKKAAAWVKTNRTTPPGKRVD